MGDSTYFRFDEGGTAVSAAHPLPTTSTASTSLATAIGSPDDAAWDGVAASATVIALLKAIAINTDTA